MSGWNGDSDNVGQAYPDPITHHPDNDFRKRMQAEALNESLIAQAAKQQLHARGLYADGPAKTVTHAPGLLPTVQRALNTAYEQLNEIEKHLGEIYSRASISYPPSPCEEGDARKNPMPEGMGAQIREQLDALNYRLSALMALAARLNEGL